MLKKRQILVQSLVLNGIAIAILAALFIGFQALMTGQTWGSTATVFYCVAACSFVGFLNQVVSANREKETERSIRGPVRETLGTLSGALSSFGSGNLVAKAGPIPLQISIPEELAELMEGLESCIGEFNGITAPITRRLCFSGCNSYQEGKVAGQRIAGLIRGKGKVLCMLPGFNQVNHALRIKGCLGYLAEKAPGIRILECVESKGNDASSLEQLDLALKRYPEIDLIYITDGFTPQFICKQLATLKGRGKTIPQVVAFDIVPENVAFLKAGIISCLIEQNMYAQTYNSLLLLYNALESGWQPINRKLFHPPQVVDLQNIREFWDEARNLRTLTEDERKILVSPVARKSKNRYKLAVLLPVATGFAQGLVNGAHAAKATLASIGVDVEIIDMFDDWGNFGSSSIFNPRIERLLAEHYHGIATSVFDSAIIPSINMAVTKGMVVTTYNSEPASFRELISNVIENVGRLAAESQSLAASAEESSRAHQQISSSVESIHQIIRGQASTILDSDHELTNLNQQLSGANGALVNYGTLVEQISSTTQKGTLTLDESTKSSRDLLNAISAIDSAMKEFSQKFIQINEIIVMIQSFAEETNVLAINAAIQAARAGEAGKGFQVVSGEVRKLAENSQKATNDISLLINTINGKMAGIVMATQNCKGLVNENFAKATEGKESFGQITQLIHQSGLEIQEINSVMQKISRAGTTVTDNMRAVESLGQQSVQRIEEIGASISQLTVEGRELSKTANALQTMADSQGLLFAQLSIED